MEVMPLPHLIYVYSPIYLDLTDQVYFDNILIR